MKYLPLFCLGVIGLVFMPGDPTIIKIMSGALLTLTLVLSFFFTTVRWVLFLLLGACYSLLRFELQIQSSVDDRNISLNNIPLQIEVVGIQEYHPHYHRFFAKVLNANIAYRQLIINDSQKREWELGSRWQIIANIRSAIGRVNQTGFNSEAWALSQGIDGYATARGSRVSIQNTYGWVSTLKHSVNHIRSNMIKRIGSYHAKYPNGTALVTSLSVGYRHHLSENNWTAFRKLGLSHLISISGLHIGMVAFLIGLLVLLVLRICIQLGVRHFLPRTPLILISAISVFGALLYTLLSGISVPTQRSMLMIAVVAYCILSRRYFSSWQIWWLALTMVLILNPASALSIGFWLSFLLVASLLLTTYTTYAKKSHTYFFNFIKAEYATTIASIIPVALLFHSFPAHSFLANLIAIPWFSFVITPLSLLSVVVPFDVILQSTLFLSEYTMQILHYLASNAVLVAVPDMPIILIILGLLATIMLLVPCNLGLKLWGLSIFLAFCLFQPKKLLENKAKITVFDVGQGLSVLIETRQHRLLYDTGSQNIYHDLVSNLYAKGITSLDMLILSYHNTNHDGAWRRLTKSLSIPVILAGQPEYYSVFIPRELTDISFCQVAQAWDWDGVHFETLTPYAEADKVSKHNKSCVLRVVTNNNAILITGDLDTKGEMKLIKQYQDDLYSTIIVLGHYGSKTSNSELFLDKVSPKFAIVSLGHKNIFHYPSQDVLELLYKRKIPLYRTDRQGAIEINMSDIISITPVIKNKPYWQKKPMYFK